MVKLFTFCGQFFKLMLNAIFIVNNIMMIDQRLSFGNNKKNKTFCEYESFKILIINIINLILKF